MSLHAKLKEATRPQHEATEHLLFPQQDWLSLSLDQYREFLQIQYVFHQQAEWQIDTALGPELQQTLRWPNRQKLPWIERDLLEINTITPTGFPKETIVASEEEAMGLLYVTEGAMLGGRMIKKALQKNEQIAPHVSFRFLAGYEGDTAAYWKSFLNVLANNYREPKTVITAAQRGFDLFAQSVYLIRKKMVS
ncbi:biliverdin-producing heme oxygenase [Tunicatimonas pelagia]|uniref:biliverdin-producing heme oxygenase n=1 Tax=Tunicatimonas pelagia TaxID=931531 RepID=UPI002666A0FB|nr:biliverdin-producing heme oxygenase [Tunicatimonas pelagia]WKN40415.1 biliverdin-producing heme oxygenase [Tunicatimonas pelagia]